ncbi:hypothetical protein WR25_16378 [Diploscapter pachys]|uniref:Uncharacterized protein n=1 Tax=Diploscapter pachys TaxID=2018661 RepID=A0A2A2KVC4_9BILA|nr:hypothetical protein WR25_16378 [Diploscapter pachys]
MIHDGIARIGHAQPVDGSEVEHVVAALLGHPQTGLPVGQGAEQLDEVRLTRHRIQGQGTAIDRQLGHHQEIATAGGSGTPSIDIELVLKRAGSLALDLAVDAQMVVAVTPLKRGIT